MEIYGAVDQRQSRFTQNEFSVGSNPTRAIMTMITALWICIGVSLAMNVLMVFSYYFLNRIPERTDLLHNGYSHFQKWTGDQVDELRRSKDYHNSRLGYQGAAVHQHDEKFKTLQPLIDYINHKNRMQKKADLDAADKAKLAELKKAVGELLK